MIREGAAGEVHLHFSAQSSILTNEGDAVRLGCQPLELIGLAGELETNGAGLNRRQMGEEKQSE